MLTSAGFAIEKTTPVSICIQKEKEENILRECVYEFKV